MSIKCLILLQWRKQAEIHVHRLERGRPRIDRVDMATGYMRKQRAMRRGSGWGRDPFAAPLGGGKTPSQQADGGGFHISLTTGNLAGEAPARVCSQPYDLIEQFWR